MSTDYKTVHGELPSRKPQLGQNPMEGDELFQRLMSSPEAIIERRQREAAERRQASLRRIYDGSLGGEDGEAD